MICLFPRNGNCKEWEIVFVSRLKLRTRLEEEEWFNIVNLRYLAIGNHLWQMV